MIDTKIACQCGTRFKFGFELAGGRAPIGLACPSCSAPVTPACDALVDYLSGKEAPAPSGDATRAVKEIKVTCACGARYKFDLELAEKDLPTATVCPQCQADLTAPANELLKAYFATQSAALKEMLAAAPVASVPAPAPDKPAEAAAAPAAAPSAPTAPPAEPAKSDAPPAAEAAKPAAPGKTEITDPFGPPSSGKAGMPNLPTLDPSKFQPANRPEKKPASTPAKTLSSSAPSKTVGKPDAAKPGAKPDAKAGAKARAAKSSGPVNVPLGVVGAFVGALIGAGIWFGVMKATGSVGTFLAVIVGALAGGGARLLGRGGAPQLAGAAATIAVIVTFVMIRTGFYAAQDRNNEKRALDSYKISVDRAKPAKEAKTDDDFKKLVQAQGYAMDSGNITEKDIQNFKTTVLPGLLALAEDTPESRAKWINGQVKSQRRGFEFDFDWDDTIGIIGLLSVVGGLLAAGFIAKP